jgi:heparan-alpha-glucosaminide N-acetyltransferase
VLTYVRLHIHNQDKWVYTLFGDILPFWPHWLVAFSLLFVYFMITFFLDVPGCGRGYLGPGTLIPSCTGVVVRVCGFSLHNVCAKGGIGDYGKYFDCTGGAAGYIDKKIFTEDHIFNQPTCQRTSGFTSGDCTPNLTCGGRLRCFHQRSTSRARTIPRAPWATSPPSSW